MRLLFVTVAVLLAGCGVSPAPRVTPELVTAAQADEASIAQADLERGRAVFTARCASCHVLPRADGYDPPTWRKWMRTMAPKARLDEDQSRDALRYVLAARRLSGDQPK